MQALAAHFPHLGVCAITCQSIDAGAQQKMRFGILGRAEQLVDVALAIANMHAPCGIA
jgi:hypothetical protein